MKEEKIERSKKIAVALSYDIKEPAPKIVATGKGIIANRILEKAKQSKVPIHTDEHLVNTLSKIEIGEFIPPELYGVVAEILVYVDKMETIKEKLK